MPHAGVKALLSFESYIMKQEISHGAVITRALFLLSQFYSYSLLLLKGLLDNNYKRKSNYCFLQPSSPLSFGTTVQIERRRGQNIYC